MEGCAIFGGGRPAVKGLAVKTSRNMFFFWIDVGIDVVGLLVCWLSLLGGNTRNVKVRGTIPTILCTLLVDLS